MARVLLADPHPLIQEGLKALARRTGRLEVVGGAATLDEACRLVERRAPDVVLVSEQLADGSGVELLRELRLAAPGVPCLLFAHALDDEVFFRAVVAGAAGCLANDVDVDELADAIAVVSAGGSLVTPSAIDDLRRQARPDPAQALLRRLTPLERRILVMVGRGMTNREISTELSLAEKTIRNYVSSILAKLGRRNRTELAAFVAGAAGGEDRVRALLHGPAEHALPGRSDGGRTREPAQP